MKNHFKKTTFITVLLCFTYNLFSIGTNHWETAVFADSTWKYFVGTTAPPSNWYNAAFDDQLWLSGKGGIGYGDNDDVTVIPQCGSVFMRIKFVVTDTTVINESIFNMDYDDAFVAFLNDVEIARSAGLTDLHPTYNQFSSLEHEAQMYQGGKPDSYYFSKSKIRKLLKIGVNVLAIQVHNISSTSSDMTARPYLSFGIITSQTFYPPSPSFVTPFSSNLPIIKVYTNGQQIGEDTKIPANMQIISNGPDRNNYSDTANNFNGKIGIEIRGSSSQMFPKKGYGMETRDDLGNNSNVKLLGMPKDNDWIFYPPYSDKTLLRDAISYYLGRKIQSYAPRMKFCELFINDSYNGVYGLVEKIKQDSSRVNITKMAVTDNAGDALTGGYILKIDRGYDGTNGFYSKYLGNNLLVPFVYVYPKPADISPQQKVYIETYINNFEDAFNSNSYTDDRIGFGKYADLESFVEFFIICEFTKNIDSYRLSTFLYKDRDSKGGKIKMGPMWDFDLSMGNANYEDCDKDYGWIIDSENDQAVPFWWKKLLQYPAFQNKLKCKWTELRTSLIRTDSLNKYIDDNVSLLSEARKRNFETFPIIGQYVWPNYYIGNTYEDEIVWLKQWIAKRIAWLDTNIPGTCLETGIDQIKEGWFSVNPNPFSDYVDFSIGYKSTGNIIVTINDINGKKIKELSAINHGNDFEKITWDCANNSGLKVLPGVYLYSITINGNLVKSGKIVKTK